MICVDHDEDPIGRASMSATHGLIALRPAADPGPAGRYVFDPPTHPKSSADGIVYEAAALRGVPVGGAPVSAPRPGVTTPIRIAAPM